MAKKMSLKYVLREGTGKSVTRKLRSAGKIPAVVYGRGEESYSVTVDVEEFKDLISQLRGKLLITELEPPSGEPFRAAIKSIQKHPLTEEFLNIDFQKIHPGEMLHVSIPIVCHGTPEGIKLGGLLDQIRYEIDVRGPVSKLPSHIDIDISGLNVGDGIRVGEIAFDEAVEVIDPPQGLIVSCTSTRKAAANLAEAETEIAEGEEGEEGEAVEGEEGETAAEETESKE